MSANEEIGILLKNIEKGLQKYSVDELNNAIVKVLTDVNEHDKTEEIQYVITIVCNYYSISQHTLKNINKRGALQEAKQIAYCLLYYNLGLTQRFIADSIFFNWQTSVANGIKRFQKSDRQLKSDKQFLEKYNILKAKLINFINEQNKNLV